MWDEEHIGQARPWPSLHEAGLAAASALYDTPNYWEEDKASSASSKNLLTTHTQHMETSMDDLRVKSLTIHLRHTPSQHAEHLLATWSTTVTATSRRTTVPRNCEANRNFQKIIKKIIYFQEFQVFNIILFFLIKNFKFLI